MGLSWWLGGKESTYQCRRRGLGRFPGEGNGKKASGLFLLLWKSSNPLMTNLVTSRVIQPLQGRSTMAQHSYYWGFNSY